MSSPIDFSPHRRTLVVGDVHGCLLALDELLRIADYVRGKDRLVFTGDLVDRGPESLGVLRRVRQLNAESVLGNHEQQHLARAARGGAETRAGQPGVAPLALTEDDLAWLSRLPLWLRIDQRWVVVHAGFEPGTAIERQAPSAMQRIRFVDEAGRWAHLDERGQSPPGSRFWAEAWDGECSVAYGHHIHDLEVPRVDRPGADVECIGLDTGCCVGGSLTALVLPSRELVQVPSPLPRTTFQPKD